jgi:hypothetical protein
MLLRQYHWYEMGTLGGLLSASSTEQRQDTASPVAEKGTLDGLFSAFSTETEAGHYLGYGRDTLGGLRVPSSGSTTPGGLFGASSTEQRQDTASPVAEKGTLGGLFSASGTGQRQDTASPVWKRHPGWSLERVGFGERHPGWSPSAFTPVGVPWVVSQVFSVRRQKHPRWSLDSLRFGK